jgi:heme-degrading monooxygenase HmoA
MIQESAANISASLLGFVAINHIRVREDYRSRFEELFGTRAKAIDRMPGFREMEVLRPAKADDPYLVISRWESEEAFQAWVGSPEFIEGHKRGFADLAEAKARGENPPMHSDFQTYEVLTR